MKIILDEIGDEYQGQYKISSMEAQYVDEILKVRSQQNDNKNMFKTSELSTISSVLCPHLLTSMIEARINLGSNAINIGAMNCYAMEVDRKNGNTMWRDALALEMFNVGVAFKILEEGQSAPTGWKKAYGHLIWDVKMDSTRKVRWVLDRHKTPDPIGSTFAGVVSRESVQIAFTYAALNGLQVFAADICNAYLQAPSSQKDYVVCGLEFRIKNVGKVALIHRTLYGGKSAGRDFRNHLRSCMYHLDFRPCPADPDVWMQLAQKGDGSPYYHYILLYVDDALVVSDNTNC